MGTWSTDILGSDAAMDVYGTFEERYYKKEAVESIKAIVRQEGRLFTADGRPVLGDNTDAWLAYALACWECQALDEETLKIVQRIADEGIDLENWEELANERKKAVAKFLKKISSPAKKIKKIPRFFSFIPPYQPGDCIVFRYPDGLYGGAICFELEDNNKGPEWINYIIGITRLRQEQKPVPADFYESHLLVYNFGMTTDGKEAGWIRKPHVQVCGSFTGKITSQEELEYFRTDVEKGEIIGRLTVHTPATTNSASLNFDFSAYHENQFAWEAGHPEAIDLSYPVKNYCRLEG